MIDVSAHTANWLDQFRIMPEERSGYTMITAMHPYHGVETFYVSLDDWHGAIKSILSPFWVNGYTVTLMPMD